MEAARKRRKEQAERGNQEQGRPQNGNQQGGGQQGTMMAAQGGYKSRPGYADAGPVDRGLTFEETVKDKIAMIYNHPKVKARGERMLEEIEMMGLTQGDPETVNRKADYMLSQLNID